MSDGQIIFPGQIIVRQRGLKWKPGSGVGVVRCVGFVLGGVAVGVWLAPCSSGARPFCCLFRQVKTWARGTGHSSLAPHHPQRMHTLTPAPPLTPPNKTPRQSVDHSLFAKAVGTIKFARFTEQMPGRPRRAVRVVSVLPLQGDYGTGYAEKAARMVAARNAHRERLLGLRAKYG
jgi:ribosomal protein L27